MKKIIFLTLTLSLLCCGHKAEKEETHKAAETTKQKNAEEHLRLGNKYYYGLGVTKDYIKAVEYYRKAFEQGNDKAQLMIGIMYMEGEGVPQDYAKAVEFCRKAAEQGLADAQGILGLIYYEGKGVPKNYIQAYKWYNIASASSDSLVSKTASDDRDELEKLMTPDQIARAKKESQEFNTKH